MNFGLRLEEERYLAAIRHAYQRGIRTFMTADVYGNGESDTLLGLALREFPRDSYCLVGAVGHDFYEGERAGSKGYPRFTDPSLRDPSGYAAYLEMATRKSLERGGWAKFNLLLLHNPDSIGYSHEAVWQGLEGLRSKGLTDRLGIAPGPANGFTLDVISCLEKFGESIDWAMLILNPLEPWPGNLALPAAQKHEVKVVTRVVDYGGLFHDDVKPGHAFPRHDHRTFRPAGWVEAGRAKLDRMRPIAQQRGLTMLQLACLWNLAHPAVESVIPTLIEEEGSEKSIEAKIDELAGLPDVQLTAEEVAEMELIGQNKGCMALKGGSHEHEGEPLPDRWSLTEQLQEVARRWGLNPQTDLAQLHA